MNLAVTVALLPALFHASPRPTGPVAVHAGSSLDTVPIVAAAVRGSQHVVVLGPNELAAEAATTTTAPPPPPPTTTTVARKVVVKAAPTTTTTVRPKPRPTTTTTAAPRPAPASGNTESGKASWYDHQAGICAHKSLPFGTVVTVTNTANGKSVQCTVGDRGPYVQGWVIDLNPREFEQLAPRSAGVISVRLDW